MRRHISVLAVIASLGLLAGALAGGSAQAAKAKKGPVVVATDAEDDWGTNVDPTIAPVGAQLGQELVEAAIEKADKKTLNFIIKVAALPGGGIPEVTRYVWTMTVDGELIQLDGKSLNYTRGACDPTAGTCPPPRDPGQGPFLVRGNCSDNEGTAVTCEEIGLVNATFDGGAATITIPVPLELIGAKVKSQISNGTQEGSGFSGVWAIPSVLFSQGNMPLDEMIVTETYVVPK
jgi:hypothetical protein